MAFETPWHRLVAVYQREILALVRRYGLTTLAPSDLKRVAKQSDFQDAAEHVAQGMVAEVFGHNASNWRQAAFKSRNGRKIFEMLQAEILKPPNRRAIQRLISENAKLISSLPETMAQQVSKYALETQTAGGRSATVEKFIQRKSVGVTKARIRMIARTEVSKAETTVTMIRAEELGITAYQWLTSEDERVRQSHRNMDKVLVFWDDAPSPEKLIGVKSTLGKYHAGCCPQCRCLAVPLASLDEVSWPARVYSNGSIKVVSRLTFQRRYPAAA